MVRMEIFDEKIPIFGEADDRTRSDSRLRTHRGQGRTHAR